MEDALFDEIVASVREGGANLRGEAKPSRTFVVDGPNVKRLRTTYQLSQAQFAALFGISVATLRNWEQGRRTPEGPARVLLQVAAKDPQAVWNVVQASPRQTLCPATTRRSQKLAPQHTAKCHRSNVTDEV